MRIVAKLVFFVALIASGGVSGTADPYPQKPVRLIVPFAAGGGTDALARLVAKKLTDKWGHQVVVRTEPAQRE